MKFRMPKLVGEVWGKERGDRRAGRVAWSEMVKGLRNEGNRDRSWGTSTMRQDSNTTSKTHR